MTTMPLPVMMNAVDRAWLEMDEPGNPMVIGALIRLDGPVDAAEFQKTLVDRLLRQPRFAQRVVRIHGTPCWIRDDDMDFRYHVQVRRLPARNYELQLRKAVSLESSRDLDGGRPLWRLFLFPQPDGPITVLFRVHHAVADGVALVTLLLDSADANLPRSMKRSHAVRGRSPRAGPLGGLIDLLDGCNTGLLRLRAAAGWLANAATARRGLRKGWASMKAARRVLSLPDDIPPPLRRPLSGRRDVTWACDIPFAPLRQAARQLEVSVNDLFMTILAGALGRHLRRQGMRIDGEQSLRVSIPVNLRAGRGRELGNRFGLVLLDLPVGVEDFSGRLRLVSERMARLKASVEARVPLLGLAAAGHLPVPLESRLVCLIGAKSAAVVSNLPGPHRHVRIAGACMRSLAFWPPQAGGIGLGVSFFTYAGTLSVGLSADRGRVPNPQLLLDAIGEEMAALHHVVHPHDSGTPRVTGT